MSIDLSTTDLEKNVSDLRFIAWDLETTGISHHTESVVEIGALAFDEEFEHRAFQTLVKPPKSIPREVVAIHGIDDSMVASAPNFVEATNQFFEFLNWAGNPRILIAHNASFDVGMFHADARRTSGARWGDEMVEIVIDSCALSRNILPDLPSHSLASLAAHFGVSKEGHHRAANDVKILKEVFLNLLGHAADRFASRSSMGLTLEMLIDLAGGYFALSPGRAEITKKAFKLSPKLQNLESMCGQDLKLGILYESDNDYRYVTPLQIKTKSSRVYLEAFCHRDGIKKTFRADRIIKLGKLWTEE